MSRESEPLARDYRELERDQRRRIWLAVVMPFALALVIFVAFIGIALSLRSPAQLAILSDSMLTLLVLCPLVVVMFPITILSIALVALMGRWQAKLCSPLRRMEALTAMVEENVEAWLGQVDEKVLNWAVRLAPARQLLSVFDPPEDAVAVEGEE